MKNPRVSILIPVFNGGKYIAETLDTVIAQTFKDWEVVLMDGGSKDNTVAIAKQYAGKHPNIFITSEPDESAYHAFHKALGKARGEFVLTLCASDGYMNDNWIKMCVEKLDGDKELSLVWGVPFDMTEDGKIVGPHFMYARFLQDAPHRGSFIKEVLRRFSNPSSMVRFIRKINSATIATASKAMKRSGPLQKREWFDYWLQTGALFPDGNMCVARRVFEECLSPYHFGTHEAGDWASFYFDFNARGYLAACIPVAASASRRFQAGNVTSRVQAYNDQKQETYFKRIAALRASLKKDPHAVVFRDRTGKAIAVAAKKRA